MPSRGVYRSQLAELACAVPIMRAAATGSLPCVWSVRPAGGAVGTSPTSCGRHAQLQLTVRCAREDVCVCVCVCPVSGTSEHCTKTTGG